MTVFDSGLPASDSDVAFVPVRDADPEREDPQLPPTPREEIEGLLYDDQSRLGDVYRLHVLQGLSPQDVADRLNIGTVGFVYGYRARIEAILDGKTMSGATLQTQVASAVRSFVKRNRGQVSPAAAQLLTKHLALAEQALSDLSSSDAVIDEAAIGDDAGVDTGKLDGLSGIYAFSYGWYLEKPVDEKSENTLIKVGQTGDVAARIRQHRGGARTHMPEPLVVVRVYATGHQDAVEVEAQFHKLLTTAGHSNPRRVAGGRSNEVGQEWFLTNEAFLDAVASVLGLRTEHIGRSAFEG